MQSAVSIPLIVCLVTSTLPLEAQDRMESAAGPIARGITREAARLTVDQTASSGDTEWSRVRKLASGSEIIVTIERAQPVERRVVRAVRVVRVDQRRIQFSGHLLWHGWHPTRSTE